MQGFLRTRAHFVNILKFQGFIVTVIALPVFILELYEWEILAFVQFVSLVFGFKGVQALKTRYLHAYAIIQILDFAASVYILARFADGWRPDSYDGDTSDAWQWLFLVAALGVTATNATGLYLAARLDWMAFRWRHVLTQGKQLKEAASLEQIAERKSVVVGKDRIASFEKRDAGTFVSNVVTTSKYNWRNWLFVFLWTQFGRLANAYNAFVVGLTFFSFSPVGPVSTMVPLMITIVVGAIKEFFEDRARHRADAKLNGRRTSLITTEEAGGGRCEERTWANVRVGDVVRLEAGDTVPADLVLLATSRSDGRVYIDTANLDGESNLKPRTLPFAPDDAEAPGTKADDPVHAAVAAAFELRCGAPSADLFNFDGVLSWRAGGGSGEDAKERRPDASVGVESMLWRGTALRSTEWALGLVVFTGTETRIEMNAGATKHKVCDTERKLNTYILYLFLVNVFICVYASVGSGNQARGAPWVSYGVDDESAWPDREWVFVSYVILFSSLIPIILYVSMDGMRFTHARFINNDLELYDEELDTPARARNTSIIEELGQVEFVFTDKTGTLTRNEMVFRYASIGGVHWPAPTAASRPAGFEMFRAVLAVAHTVIPSAPDATGGEIEYSAPSPDESALVLGARSMGLELLERRGAELVLRRCGGGGARAAGREVWSVLHVIEFSSERKRMSAVVRAPAAMGGRTLLLTKGADDAIFARLCAGQEALKARTSEHLLHFASQGLRTLTLAYRELDSATYSAFKLEWEEASKLLLQRQAALDAAAATVECGLTLLGATAIEDRLQERVPETLSALRDAGMKVWVLTGDKLETARAIALASHAVDDSTQAIHTITETEPAALLARLRTIFRADELLREAEGEAAEGVGSIELSDVRRALYEGQPNRSLFMCAAELPSMHPRTKMPSNPRSCAPKQANSAHKRPRITGVVPTSGSLAQEYRRSLSRCCGCCGEDGGDEDGGGEGGPAKPRAATLREMALVEEKDVALILDGPALACALRPEIRHTFAHLAKKSRAVVCARCAPKQKADVVRLISERTVLWGGGPISLAVGDGANDVPMIQAANVGIGIEGKEGTKAVLASDFSLAKFHHLQRLLLVHGAVSYRRMSKLISFTFTKNFARSFSVLWFVAPSMYSGTLQFLDWDFGLYNTFFTTLPLLAVATYDQDLPSGLLLAFPELYCRGPSRYSFNLVVFFGWCFVGVWHALVGYHVAFELLSDGGMYLAGTANYAYLILSVSVEVALLHSTWTRKSALVLGFVLAFYTGWLFLTSWVGGVWTCCNFPNAMGNARLVSAAEFGTASRFWLGALLAVVLGCLPHFAMRSMRVIFAPKPWHRAAHALAATRGGFCCGCPCGRPCRHADEEEGGAKRHALVPSADSADGGGGAGGGGAGGSLRPATTPVARGGSAKASPVLSTRFASTRRLRAASLAACILESLGYSFAAPSMPTDSVRSVLLGASPSSTTSGAGSATSGSCRSSTAFSVA